MTAYYNENDPYAAAWISCAPTETLSVLKSRRSSSKKQPEKEA